MIQMIQTKQKSFIVTVTKSKQFYSTIFPPKNIKNLKNKQRGIKKIISLHNSKQTIPTAMTNKNKAITNLSGIANAFNNHFTKVAIDIRLPIKFP